MIIDQQESGLRWRYNVKILLIIPVRKPLNAVPPTTLFGSPGSALKLLGFLCTSASGPIAKLTQRMSFVSGLVPQQELMWDMTVLTSSHAYAPVGY